MMNRIVFQFFFAAFIVVLESSDALSQPPLATGKPKFIGNIYNSSGAQTVVQFTKYWNQVTPENAGKWGSVEGAQDSYYWDPLDAAYNFAKQNGLLYKHHTLVWGSQQPSWMTDGSLDSASQRAEVEEWIQLSGTRYPNADFVDVVNEPLHAPPSYKNALGGDGVTGWDWVITAFELAREHWPNAKLHLNDYSIINNRVATINYFMIINLLKDRGLIDGIGIQGHSFEVTATSVSNLKSNLDYLVATGLPIYISEFDINDTSDTSQLEKYQAIFPALYEHPGVKGVTFWGYIQGEIWQTDAYLLRNNLGTWVERPAMEWLRNYSPAPTIPNLIYPYGLADVERNPILRWNTSELATSYRLQLDTIRTFSAESVLLDTTLSDTLLPLSVLEANKTYYWRVNASNYGATSSYSLPASFITGDVISSIEGQREAPAQYTLSQNYPNPFNPATTIEFSLPERSAIRMTLLNVLGQVVKELASGEYNPGSHRVVVDASDLPSGMYYYRIQAGASFVQTRKMILLK